MINNKAMNGQHKSPLKSVPCVMCWTILVVYLYNIQLQFCQCAPDPVKVFFLSNIAFSCLCHRLLAPKIALAEGEIHCKWAAWMCFLAVTLQLNSFKLTFSSSSLNPLSLWPFPRFISIFNVHLRVVYPTRSSRIPPLSAPPSLLLPHPFILDQCGLCLVIIKFWLWPHLSTMSLRTDSLRHYSP